MPEQLDPPRTFVPPRRDTLERDPSYEVSTGRSQQKKMTRCPEIVLRNKSVEYFTQKFPTLNK